MAESLLLRKEVTIGVRICSSLDMMERLLEIGQIKVLLISEEIPYEERRQIFNGKRIILTRTKCVDLGEEEIQIRKYQSVDVISAEILRVFQEITANPFPIAKRKKGKIMAVYSPIHRIGKTTFSLKLGKRMAEKENVLYLNLETYAGMGGYFQEENVQNLSHLLYYAKQDQDDISVRIASMVRQMGNLDYISPMQVWTDLRRVDINDWCQFFEKLSEQSIYDLIILDLGNNVENVFDMLRLCDVVLLLHTEDVYGVAKMKQYKYMIHVLGYQDLERRSIYVNADLPFRQSIKTALEEIERWRGRDERYASGKRTS